MNKKLIIIPSLIGLSFASFSFALLSKNSMQVSKADSDFVVYENGDLGLVDYVAMDVKAPFEKYNEVIKADIGDKVKECMEIVNEYKDITLECRTTYCPVLLSEEDLFKIADEVKCDLYTLQQFRNRCVLDESLAEAEEPNPHDMEDIAKRIKEAHPEQDINVKTAEFGQRSV